MGFHFLPSAAVFFTIFYNEDMFGDVRYSYIQIASIHKQTPKGMEMKGVFHSNQSSSNKVGFKEFNLFVHSKKITNIKVQKRGQNATL